MEDLLGGLKECGEKNIWKRVEKKGWGGKRIKIRIEILIELKGNWVENGSEKEEEIGMGWDWRRMLRSIEEEKEKDRKVGDFIDMEKRLEEIWSIGNGREGDEVNREIIEKERWIMKKFRKEIVVSGRSGEEDEIDERINWRNEKIGINLGRKIEKDKKIKEGWIGIGKKKIKEIDIDKIVIENNEDRGSIVLIEELWWNIKSIRKSM